MNGQWIKEFPGSITVSDEKGTIIEMNDRAVKTFLNQGGANLIGENLLDVHPEPARSKVIELLAKRTANTYTIEKNGIKKLVYQTPWYKNNKFAGLVEFSLEIPFDLPHYVRQE